MKEVIDRTKDRPTVLVVDDDPANLDLFDRLFRQKMRVLTALSTKAAEDILAAEDIHVLVCDQRMPIENGIAFITRIADLYPHSAKVILTGYVDRNAMRQAFQTGRILDFVFKPFEKDDMEAVLERGFQHYSESLRQQREQLALAQSSQPNEQSGPFDRLIGREGGLRDLVERLRRIAKNGAHLPVLLRGESGTGKELVARAIHLASDRSEAPFVAINCPAIPESLWESELFGHEKGAFSHAIKQKLGRFELADRGTLFLDEIGELPEHLQVKLLRALQERSFERVGGTHSISVDVRIIAATNRNLEQAISLGTFREDLFFRLNVLPVLLPPLRARTMDIPALAAHFLLVANQRTGKTCQMPRSVLESLTNYPWPGNIRELENLIDRAVVLCPERDLRLEDFQLDLASTPPIYDLARGGPNSITQRSIPEEGFPDFRLEIQQEMIHRYKDALRQAGGNISKAARILGIHRRTLTDRLRKAALIE